MYEAFYNLNRRPFVPAPDPNYYFPAEAIETARQNLLRCLQRGEGPGLVIGASGTGKTLLCQVLAEQLRPTLAVVFLCSGRLSSRNALYQTILHGLQRPYRGMDEGESRLALVDYLTAGEDRPRALVLLVDEAQTLPLRLLDEIRMLTNLVDAGESRVRVILTGSPILEERFASPKLESFSQRVVARCYLESFNRCETEQYIRAQIEAAGGDAVQCFATEAAAAVYQATDGVPRLVNQVCDHALLLAYADGDSKVDACRVETAWADLQQLPAPWSGDAATDGAPDIIEFGGLDDDTLPCDETYPGDSAALELLSTRGEPDTRVEQIERTLSDLEPRCEAEDAFDAFEPAGSITPEIELVFDEPGDALAESFDEEEILPRYGETATSAPTGPPTRPFVRETESVDSRPAETHVDEVLSADTRTPAAPTSVPLVASIEDTEPTLSNRRERSRAGAAATALHAEEDMIIIVDEDLPEEDEDELAAPRLVVPRRNEYRQLFAKLRNG